MRLGGFGCLEVVIPVSAFSRHHQRAAHRCLNDLLLQYTGKGSVFIFIANKQGWVRVGLGTGAPAAARPSSAPPEVSD